MKHLKNDVSFPHEIGLFPEYPPSDVKKFMEDPCKGVKCVDCRKDRCKSSGANLVIDSVMANNEPGEDALEECRPLGKALV